MADFNDDDNYVTYEGFTAIDSDDPQEDADPNEVRVEDPEENVIFSAVLNREIEQPQQIASEPEETLQFQDDIDEALSDSGIDDETGSLGSNEPNNPPEISIPNVPIGRGRQGKTATDENDRPLPPPKIRDVSEDGFYSKPGRKIHLPASYYQKRSGQFPMNIHRIEHRETALIDFQVEFKQISFIVDKVGLGDQGYSHACARFKDLLPDSNKFDLPKEPNYDIWSFGLHNFHVNLPQSIPMNIHKLIPEKFDNESHHPYWFTFKPVPTFSNWNLPKLKVRYPEKQNFPDYLIDRSIYADLAYGALTSIRRFAFDPDFIFRKKTRWSFNFFDERFEIFANQSERLSDDSGWDITQVKYRFPLDIIDRVAVIQLWNDGFTLFLNMKGNVHFLKRNKSSSSSDFFVRQGNRDDKPIPLFSTIRLRIRLKEEGRLAEYFEKDQQNGKTPANNIDDYLKNIIDEGILQIKYLFTKFLEFFDKNHIHVSFGSITSKAMNLNQVLSIRYHVFPTFIKSYSWTMLHNIGFRVLVQLYTCKEFVRQLKDYSTLRYDKETDWEADDRFYRLCLYLHRRTSEYFFLDLDEEIKNGINRYKAQYDQARAKGYWMHRFNENDQSTAYIPSVVLTPTTIKIRPLKLCKLNRILREKRFGRVTHFCLVELRDEAQRMLFPNEFRALRDQILNYLTNGFELTPKLMYTYLHHSQSQVKAKQFWFYHHDETNLSHNDAYIWMGNFDKERVVSKHTARIALCFTSSDETIRIPAETVKYERDIKDSTGDYTFSDGVGQISAALRDKIKHFIDPLDRRRSFSVLQIRYGGCKGTVSVVPQLDDKKYQLIMRDSMNKFISDHDKLEVCKLSAPRTLYLNRQDIILLESRDVPHTNFLAFQNEYHFKLIKALLNPNDSHELLSNKLLPVFKLDKIIRNFNVVEEQFFIKLLVTCIYNVIRELLDRTRVYVSSDKARNMFGIVDEYAVLEEGEVFVQYTRLHEHTLERTERTGDERVILEGNVVITKNPCHHPGDLRVFKAVNRKELHHLVDCVVFPQKGRRPHPNEISGSDLDGDEYVVIWHEYLIPTTENEEAYNYDGQDEPKKMERPIERKDIIDVVMEISEQDCLGSLSNIHLAYADREGVKSDFCKKLAGWISEEVDAAKTGHHPVSSEDLYRYKEDLGNEWPDFMKTRGSRKYYRSKRILGKLYRSAERAAHGWSRAIRQHGNPRYQTLVTELDSTSTNPNEEIRDAEIRSNSFQPLDKYIYHKNYEKYLEPIKRLYGDYRYELLEIISLYRFQDEIDLLCRCESMDASAGGKKGGLEDSAAMEVKNLVQRIRQEFYAEFDERRKKKRCCEEHSVGKRLKIHNCERCSEDKKAKAACAYIYSYERSRRLPPKSNRRVLSFPWLFSEYLIRLKWENRPKDVDDRPNFIIANALALYTEKLVPEFKVFVPNDLTDTDSVIFHYGKKQVAPRTFSTILAASNETKHEVSLLNVCCIEILNDWLIKQKIFGDECIETESKPLVPSSIWQELIVYFITEKYQENVFPSLLSTGQNYISERYTTRIREYSKRWAKDIFYQTELHGMFCKIHDYAIERARATQLMVWAYLDDYILSALQCIGIEKCLSDGWIK
ncbi:unnamed protein product [Adineta ricciae]|uniref:RNA-directed RNA polymerase n=1 Tax=Adineta ricciae TaxID=249248 RepID=A0A813YGY6_ADIRI|nr:unnamed protein product [Adineta ricciae]